MWQVRVKSMRTVGQAVVASGRVLKAMWTVGQAVVANGRVLKSMWTVGRAVVASGEASSQLHGTAHRAEDPPVQTTSTKAQQYLFAYTSKSKGC